MYQTLDLDRTYIFFYNIGCKEYRYFSIKKQLLISLVKLI